MKKIFFAVCLFCLCSSSFFAEGKGLFGSTFTKPANSKEFWAQVSPFVNVGLVTTLSTADKTKTAPSPINFALSFGGVWPNTAFVSFQPRLSFYTNYYLWNNSDNYAYPAEVESRTATALSFMLDLPAAATFRFENSQVELGAGVGVLVRIAILSKGVSSDDSGTSGSAGGDKSEIQKWFWKDARFLYPEIFAGWNHKISENISLGAEARYYLPLGSIVSGHGIDASIIAVSGKVIF